MTPVNILVVDNEEDQRRLMHTILKGFGYSPATASSAEAALRAIAAVDYHLIITDLIMPGMEGIELCEKIKRMRPETKVYAFSGHAGLYPDHKLKQAGFDGIITKPVSMTILKKALDSAVGGRRSPAKKHT